VARAPGSLVRLPKRGLPSAAAGRQRSNARRPVEGNSIRATVRLTGAAKNTITKLLSDLGGACGTYQDRALRDLPCTTIRCDEIWSYYYSKQKNIPEQHKGTFGYGDVWTWTAICADTKLVPSWLVGERTYEDALAFMVDLETRLAGPVQLTTDGYHVYLNAVPPPSASIGSITRHCRSSTALPRSPIRALQPCDLHGGSGRVR
jgi:IS1 family transposase